MNAAAAQVSAASKSVVRDFDDFQVANGLEHRAHLTGGNETFIVERYQHIRRVNILNKVGQPAEAPRSDVIIRTLPIGWYSRNVAHAFGSLVIDEQVKREIVGSIRMLVVWRIEIDQVQAAHLLHQSICIPLVHLDLGIKSAQNWNLGRDLAPDPKQRIPIAASELPDAGAAIFVKSLKDARRVGVYRGFG